MRQDILIGLVLFSVCVTAIILRYIRAKKEI